MTPICIVMVSLDDELHDLQYIQYVKAIRDVKDCVTILVKHVIRIYIQG